MKTILLALVALAALTLYVSDRDGDVADAANPGTVDAPLISCANVTGDNAGAVSGLDFFAVLGKFGTTFPNAGFSYLYDLNADNSVAGSDFFAVLGDFGVTCPAVDNQVALATLWGIGGAPANCPGGAPPAPPLTLPPGNDAAIEAIGYYRGSFDVPGQGIHYVKPEHWDGTFDPCRPEGLVYDDGRLVAQLYVINGDAPGIGWNGWNPGTGGGAITGVEVDSFCTPSPCSWAGAETWHAHANLCSSDIGTASASAIPGQSLATCDAGNGSDPSCTIPITAQPCWLWSHRNGWMGHLWNHDLNENLIPDVGGNNGRFADCAPPSKHNNCPM
jgi:hypothetical protein